jgi:hypothetical protein
MGGCDDRRHIARRNPVLRGRDPVASLGDEQVDDLQQKVRAEASGKTLEMRSIDRIGHRCRSR